RTTLVRGTAQKGRVNRGLRTTRNRGKVNERVDEQPAHPTSWIAPLHLGSETRLGEQQTGAGREEEEKGHQRRLRVLSAVEKNEAAPLNKVQEGAQRDKEECGEDRRAS
ncbi:hypothetical protein, partial [Acidovorax facilis]|uniref:hypothetical protein n=1 Tax=Acidovorax facilis TaxID=12917 RepID=UPI003670C96C